MSTILTITWWKRSEILNRLDLPYATHFTDNLAQTYYAILSIHCWWRGIAISLVNKAYGSSWVINSKGASLLKPLLKTPTSVFSSSSWTTRMTGTSGSFIQCCNILDDMFSSFLSSPSDISFFRSIRRSKLLTASHLVPTSTSSCEKSFQWCL